MSDEIVIIDNTVTSNVTFEQLLLTEILNDPENSDLYETFLEVHKKYEDKESWNIDIDTINLLIQQLIIYSNRYNLDLLLIIPTISKHQLNLFLKRINKSPKRIGTTLHTGSIGREFLDFQFGELSKLPAQVNPVTKDGSAEKTTTSSETSSEKQLQSVKFNMAAKMVVRQVGDKEIGIDVNDSTRAYSRDTNFYILPRFETHQLLGVILNTTNSILKPSRTSTTYTSVETYNSRLRQWYKELKKIGIVRDDYYNVCIPPKSFFYVDNNSYQTFFGDFQNIEDKAIIENLKHMMNIVRSILFHREIKKFMRTEKTEFTKTVFKPFTFPDKPMKIINKNLIQELEKIGKFRINFNDPYKSMISNKIFYIYVYSLTHGVENKYIQKYIEKLKSSLIIEDNIKQDLLTNIRNSNKQKLFNILKAQRFGDKKPNKNQLIQLREEVDKELEKYKKKVTNNCNHVVLLEQLNRDKSNNIRKRLLKKLQKYIPKKIETNKMINCTTCGFEIICPHEYYLLQNRIYSKVDDYNIIKDYLARIHSDNPVCRVCNGQIKNIKQLDVDINDRFYSMSYENTEIIQILYGDLNEIRTHVEFIYPVNNKEFIGSAIEVCKNLVIKEDNNLNRNIVLNIEQVNNARRIYISIVAYTYVLSFIQKGFAKINKSNKEVKEILKTINQTDIRKDYETVYYTLAMLKKRRTVNLIKTYTIPRYVENNIYKLIVDVYQKITKEKLIKKPEKAKKYDIEVKSLKYNPIYQYVSRVHGGTWNLQEWVKSIPKLKGDSLFVKSYNAFVDLVDNKQVDITDLLKIEESLRKEKHNVLILPVKKTRQYIPVKISLSKIYNIPGDDTDVKKQLEKKSNIDNFYNIFKIRCPEEIKKNNIDSNHDFKKSDKCSKCGMILNKQDEQIYKKYKTIYDNFLVMMSEDINFTKLKETHINVTKDKYKKIIDKVDNYVYELSKIANINPSQILLIGFYENQELIDIKNGKITAPVVTSKYHPVIELLKNYVLTTLRTYYSLKNNNRIKLSERYELLIESLKINKSELILLKDITFEDDFVKNILNPDELHRFYLSSLCKILLTIYKIDSIGVKLFNSILNEILSSEEQKTKMKKIQFSYDYMTEIDEDENYVDVYKTDIDPEEYVPFKGFEDLDLDDVDEDNDIRIEGHSFN